MKKKLKCNNVLNKRSVIILIIVIALLIILAGYFATDKSRDEEGLMSLYMDTAVDSITLNWEGHEKASNYEIYRIDISEGAYANGDIFPKWNEYRLIACVNGDIKSYSDNDVQEGHTYAYAVSGYYEKFGGEKQVCTTYEENSIIYETVGPGKPRLLNHGNGENYENSKDNIYLYVESYTGLEPDGVALYRKSEQQENFEEIGFKQLDSQFEILDDSVKPGETYTYKARTFVKENGKIVHSPYSDEITIPAVNFSAEYEVKTIEYMEDIFVIQVSSSENNGTTVFEPTMPAKYTVQKDKQSITNVFCATLTSCSTNHHQWKEIPKEGVCLNAGECIYLKYKLSAYEGYDENANLDEEIFFGGDEALVSVLFMDETDWGGAKYYGSGSGCTVMTLDLTTGKGNAYCDWDY